MRRLLATSLVLATLGTGLTSMALAQDARSAQPAVPAEPAPTDQGMMMGGDMPAMMGHMNKMMVRMNNMMDACEKMMQSADHKDRRG